MNPSTFRLPGFLASAGLICALGGLAVDAHAEGAADLDRDSGQALQNLYKTNPVALSISRQARAILVFPKIVKAGLIFGGAYGEGELMKDGREVAFYNSVTASWGWQIGAESYGYVVFLMNDKAEKYLNNRPVRMNGFINDITLDYRQ